MWGNILTELAYLQNFNMSFSNTRSDVLIHLTQWQYWWWFWFTFLWSLYYFLVARVFRYRTLKFNPRIATTLRPHGKWGDLLACAIPVTWCVNILLNSNFILKLIEWQSESSLFTLRVRAKQWYWIYKLDLRNITDVFSAPRNIGRNKWQSATFGDLQTAEDYLHILQMRAYTAWSKEFWTELNKKSMKKHNFKIAAPVQAFKIQYIDNVLLTKYFSILESKNLLLPRSITPVEACIQFITLKGKWPSAESKVMIPLIKEPKEIPLSVAVRHEDEDIYQSCIASECASPTHHFADKDFTLLNSKLDNVPNFQPLMNFSSDWVIKLTPQNYRQRVRGRFTTSPLNLAQTLLKYEDFNLDQLTIKNKFNTLVFMDEFDSKNLLAKKQFQMLQKKPKVLKRPPHWNLVWLKKVKAHNTSKAFNKFFKQEILINFDLPSKNLLQHSDFDDETRLIRRNFGKSTPIRLLKCPNTDIFFKDNITTPKDIELFRFRFNQVKSNTAIKPVKPTVYLTFKQKRYNQRVNIALKNVKYFDNKTQSLKNYSGNPFLKDNSIIEENFGSPTKQYRLLKKAKTRVENTKVANWNRLLRSRRVLVLPAHINITVITNSFDVVHSWHIPGLGLKMDCLPGRATHHTLYIDNVGLYYGQCAEICGRYHHHMPIRICALPFEHFLVWWHTFGLPKFLFPRDKDKVTLSSAKYFSRKFAW